MRTMGDLRTFVAQLNPGFSHLSSLDRYTASLWSLRANSSILLGIVRSFFTFSVSVCGLAMSLVGTFETCSVMLRMSVHWGGSEVAVVRSNRANDPKRLSSVKLLCSAGFFLFDHLVGEREREHGDGKLQAEHLGGLEVDHRLRPPADRPAFRP